MAGTLLNGPLNTCPYCGKQFSPKMIHHCSHVGIVPGLLWKSSSPTLSSYSSASSSSSFSSTLSLKSKLSKIRRSNVISGVYNRIRSAIKGLGKDEPQQKNLQTLFSSSKTTPNAKKEVETQECPACRQRYSLGGLHLCPYIGEVQCRECRQRFSDMKTLTTHFTRDHFSGKHPATYFSDSSNSSSSSSSNSQIGAVFDRLLPHHCPVCPAKAFALPDALLCHLEQHGAFQTPTCCSACQETTRGNSPVFASLLSLYRHICKRHFTADKADVLKMVRDSLEENNARKTSSSEKVVIPEDENSSFVNLKNKWLQQLTTSSPPQNEEVLTTTIERVEEDDEDDENSDEDKSYNKKTYDSEPECTTDEEQQKKPKKRQKKSPPSRPSTSLKCSTCSLCYSSERGLSYHIRMKHPELFKGRLRYRCPSCPMPKASFTKTSSLKRHFRRAHSDRLMVKCVGCPEGSRRRPFLGFQALYNHIRGMHKQMERTEVYECMWKTINGTKRTPTLEEEKETVEKAAKSQNEPEVEAVTVVEAEVDHSETEEEGITDTITTTTTTEVGENYHKLQQLEPPLPLVSSTLTIPYQQQDQHQHHIDLNNNNSVLCYTEVAAASTAVEFQQPGTSFMTPTYCTLPLASAAAPTTNIQYQLQPVFGQPTTAVPAPYYSNTYYPTTPQSSSYQSYPNTFYPTTPYYQQAPPPPMQLTINNYGVINMQH